MSIAPSLKSPWTTAEPLAWRPLRPANWIDRWGAWTNALPLRTTALAVLAIVVTVAVLDRRTGDAMPLSILYLPAVALVSWRISLRVAVLLALVCSLLWLIDDVLAFDPRHVPWAKCWLTSIHFAFFTVICGTITRLERSLDYEQAAARTDVLTGLPNRAAFYELAQRELARAARTGAPLTVVFVDCDHFKEVNDRFGHHVGDRVLRAVADTLQRGIRGHDVAARLGGDEFALLLSDTPQERAHEVVHRIEQHLADEMQRQDLPVTLSAGVVTYLRPPDTIVDLLREADERMYEVKRTSRAAAAYAVVG